MKKIFLLILLTCLLIMCTSCRARTMYNYMHSPKDIVQVSIVAVSSDPSEGLMIDHVIVVIDDKGTFLDEFRKVPCYTFFGDPRGISPEDSPRVIQFEYSNGDYELISDYGTARHQSGIGIQNYTGFQIFDEASFLALIDRYANEDSHTENNAENTESITDYTETKDMTKRIETISTARI